MGYDFNRSAFLLPCRVRHLSKRELDRQLRQTLAQNERLRRILHKARLQSEAVALQMASLEADHAALKLQVDISIRQMTAIIGRLEAAEARNEALRRALEARMDPSEQLDLRAWMASFKDLAPYAFSSLAILILAFFIVLDRVKSTGSIAASDADVVAGHSELHKTPSGKRYDFHEQKVRDLEKEHPPGDKTIEEWLDELERIEQRKNIHPQRSRDALFMGGSHEHGEWQWRAGNAP